jgi:hypothetical protein
MVALDACVPLEPELPVRQLLATAARAAFAVAVGAVVVVWMAQRLPPSAPSVVGQPTAATAPARAAMPNGALFDPGFLADSRPSLAPRRATAVNLTPAQQLALAAALPTQGVFSPSLRQASTVPSLRRAPPTLVAALPAAEDLSPPPKLAPADEAAPLPPPRPAEATRAEPLPPAAAAPAAVHAQARIARSAPAPAATAPGDRGYFPPASGVERLTGRMLAYAAAPGAIGDVWRGLAFNPASRYDRYTAVYDLADHTVYMPDGTRLEAHSGLGDRLDDPAHVNERQRGATPPHLYELSLREVPFHGVQALRLNPVGGGDIFGRAGLLAHTYMLGPNGDSNGCVSFKNYDAFLQAYRSGEVKRLAVVARLD